MKRQDFIKAFAEMSTEDQEAIRAELIGKAADPIAKCHSMMEQIMASGNPMAMCQEMMEKMKAGGNPKAVFQNMTQKMTGKCR